VPIPESGFKAAVDKLNAFKPEKYKDLRDIPEEEATSGMSVFLKNGSITTSQIVYHLGLKPYDEKKSSKDTYLSELVWREFYYHILYHKPEVETEEFNSKYSGLKWDNNEKFFELWKEGKTGYPIVDAGMRQLKTTGLMHNRVRMIVASFLTKHLLIDWRWGEQYFMEQLLDGDLAPNNGGWQWAASTGCDAQPYFRVFNPWLQSKKFDPDGHYIKKYIPELSEIESKKLHEPITDHAEYPAPIVEHKASRERAIEVYKSHSS
jgi:deoxyribodipyrimidine photo-lyase